MINALPSIPDRSTVGGMDTYHNSVSESFPPNRCILLQNMFPGDPPVPISGCQDQLVDIAMPEAPDGLLFRPPCVAIRNSDNRLHAFLMAFGANRYYQLECWNIDEAERYRVVAGEYGDATKFALLPLDGKIYLFSSDVQSSNYVSNQTRLGHKIAEWNDTAYAYQERELWIDQYATIGTPTQAASSSGLTPNLWVSYAATFVRLPSEYAGAQQDAFVQAINESAEALVNRKRVFLSPASMTSYGDAATMVHVKFKSDTDNGGGITRYTAYDQDGEVAIFTGLEVGDYLTVQSDAFSGQNTGTYRVANISDGVWIELENAYGIDEETVLGSVEGFTSGAIEATIPLPETSVIGIAEDQGATHIRLWRSDHAQTEEIAKGLTHRWLVDVPIDTTEVSFVDSITRNALLGETNVLSMTEYTAPPQRAGFAAFSAKAGRIFAGGDPLQRGRWWYSEFPGGDGATQLAQQIPDKFRSMWRTTDYWLDCDPDDGQLDTGVMTLRDDIFFFKERKVFVLYNSDTTQKPLCVSHNIGCPFPNTIINIDMPGIGEVIFFLSNEGPAIIAPGGAVQVFGDFAIAEMWPGGELLNTATSEYLSDIERYKVHAIFHKNTIWVCWGDSEDPSSSLTTNKVYGYYRAPDQRFAGCLKFTIDDFTG